MRLIDLHPKWYTVGGPCSEERPHVGLILDCPCGCGRRVAVNIDPPIGDAKTLPHAWQRTGETFDNITLSPSLLIHGGAQFRDPTADDAEVRTCKGWHGWIRNGEVTNA